MRMQFRGSTLVHGAVLRAPPLRCTHLSPLAVRHCSPNAAKTLECHFLGRTAGGLGSLRRGGGAHPGPEPGRCERHFHGAAIDGRVFGEARLL